MTRRDSRGTRLEFPRGKPAKRVDHNCALVRARCEKCGKEQKNDSMRCRGCKHEFGVYA